MCHPRSLTFFTDHIKPEQVRGKLVLEVGSYNVNGTMRTVVEPMGPAEYLGVDLRPGPGVDKVFDFSDYVFREGNHFYPDWLHDFGHWDFVICIATLEHVRDWRQVMYNLRACLKPGGFMDFSVPTPGFTYHAEPVDYWRWTPEQVREMFADFMVIAEEVTTSPYLIQIIVRKPPVVDLKAIHPMEMPQPC